MAKTTDLAEDERENLDYLDERADKLLKVGIIVTIIFGAATIEEFLRGFIGDHIEYLRAADSVVWKLAIVIYFTSWILGVEVDKSRQMRIYAGAPKQVRIDPFSVIAACLIFVLFGVMFAAEELSLLVKASAELPTGGERAGWVIQLIQHIITDRPRVIAIYNLGPLIFLLAINLLWILNVLLWKRYLAHFINPLADYSRQIFRRLRDPKDRGYARLEKLDIMDEYMKGRWQSLRFIVGSVFLVLLDIIFYRFMPDMEALTSFRAPLILSLFTAAYVILIEGWIWLRRFRTGVSLAYIDSVSRKYALALPQPPRPPQPPQPPPGRRRGRRPHNKG